MQNWFLTKVQKWWRKNKLFNKTAEVIGFHRPKKKKKIKEPNLNLNMKCKHCKTFRKKGQKSLGSQTKKRVLRFDGKSTIYNFFKKKLINWNASKFTTFALREHMNKMHTSYRQKIFANHVPDKGLVSRTNEKLKKLH